jgi:hypothetical protein
MAALSLVGKALMRLMTLLAGFVAGSEKDIPLSVERSTTDFHCGWSELKAFRTLFMVVTSDQD